MIYQRRKPMNMYNGLGGDMRSAVTGRLLLAGVLILFALFSYFGSRVYNPVTGENQHISITEEQEIALGLEAVPQMMQQFGGEYPDPRLQEYVDQVGFAIVNNSAAKDTNWKFEFHLLDDPETINAFALPGGQVFITTALYGKLETEGQLAGILGHEIGHVVARHGAQRMAKEQLTQGVTGAVVVASGSQGTAQLAQMIGQMVNMSYGREDELQSDNLSVRFMCQAGYDPKAMIRVMEILNDSRGGEAPPEMFSTHPNPENRKEKIQEAMTQYAQECSNPNLKP